MTDRLPFIPVSLRQLAFHTKTNADNEILAFDMKYQVDRRNHHMLRFDALLIILWYQGTGRAVINMQEYDLRPGTLLVLKNEDFVQVTECSEDFRSHTVVCSNGILMEVMPKISSIMPLMVHHAHVPVIYLTPEEQAGIEAFYKFVKLKLDAPETQFTRQKVLCMLQAALFEIMDISHARLSVQKNKVSRRNEIMGQFMVNVSRHFKEHREVAYYAKLQSLTAKHLSAVVKEISGRTAGDWIDRYVMTEAKMLLGSTDMSIQQISNSLHFPNQSFFGKFFKHNSGQTPSQFRKMSQSAP